jgi:hypothetical protein
MIACVPCPDGLTMALFIDAIAKGTAINR